MLQKNIAFTLENTKAHHLIPTEDSFKIKIGKRYKIIAVADGITRDPLGLPNLASPRVLIEEIKFVEKYPRPSPAKIAADAFCRTFIQSVQTDGQISQRTVADAFSKANEKIKILNQKRNPHPDYLENDFWSCVASGGVIKDQKLYWGYICDCGVCIFDKNGKLKFHTENDKEKADKLGDFKGKSWRDPKWRYERRKEYRNNPLKRIGGKIVSYGALTGEENALFFLKTGMQKLHPGDRIFFYSDGMEKIVYSKEFRKILMLRSWDEMEEECKRLHQIKEGAEATLVGIVVE